MTRRLTTLAVAALATTLLLTGCTTNGGDKPAPSPSASASAAPTKTASENEPGQMEPPKTASEAIAVSKDAIIDFLTARAEIMEDSGAQPERIAPYATGPALEQLNGEAASVAQLTASIKGLPKWTVDTAQTTAGSITQADGTVTDNGVTYIRGCFDTSTQVGTRADGGELTRPNRPNTPMEFQVHYSPEAKSWLVYALISLTDKEGAPVCG
ncbi:hypothetical protein ITJ57_18740 [Plantibacter sp. VKM Ac-2880]|uniref:hypothetical protein n=1 Tax=Plantibacter sp. VKM Ac-2880 TaxID=2783827 RepID=UPI00188F4315|nr:hypothetical protein [Plantibacter sp. VKM Ac-2880]MBF4570811.1 hypothetical protein [Plantibacter sp. VKM Ac-2880]